MKITRKQLQRVIKEEVQRYLSEGDYSYGARDGDGSKIDAIMEFLPEFENYLHQSHQYFYEGSADEVGLDPTSQEFKDLWGEATARKYGKEREAEKAYIRGSSRHSDDFKKKYG